jgi:drug/metabolite transporter (DMT)-like permease
MPSKINSNNQSAMRLGIALALVYVVWGTTYYGITVAAREMPPLLMNGARFLLAGLVMVAIARWQGQAWPTAPQWRHASIVGVLMVLIAMSCVTFAQKLGIGSGLMATVVTTMPMWLALWTRLGGERVPLTSWVGLALGFVGALLLAQEGDFSATVTGGLLAFAAPLCWSLGSYASRKLDLPAPAMASGAEWLVGGALGTALGCAVESPAQMAGASASAWAAWAYLLIFGTLIALNAYLWLLQNTSAALAGSYAFVNPAVALAVGVWLGNERLTGWVWLALPLIFLALALIMYGRELVSWIRSISGAARETT